MKKDPYNHKQRYLNWKDKIQNVGIPGIKKSNSDLIRQYIFDMEHGINISNLSKKGARSYIRLNNLKQRLIFLTKELERRFDKCIIEIEEKDLFEFFAGMRNGTIKRLDGQVYQSVTDYVKVFKAFWHWYIKVSKKQGKIIEDITADLDTSKTKPKWVYLDEDQIKLLYEKATYEYRMLIMFLYDTGIRAPTELINVKVNDINSDCKELSIRDEVSKTFGRRIKLMLCSGLLKGYIKEKQLNPEDYLFPVRPYVVNRYLKRLGERIFGDKASLAGQKYSELTMYDFRHCSCCYWLPRYKSESALKYRFGWKKSEKIHYYSELLGMKDTISEEDLLMDVTKTEIEKRLTQSENEKERLKDRVMALESQMQKILQHVDKLDIKIEV